MTRDDGRWHGRILTNPAGRMQSVRSSARPRRALESTGGAPRAGLLLEPPQPREPLLRRSLDLVVASPDL